MRPRCSFFEETSAYDCPELIQTFFKKIGEDIIHYGYTDENKFNEKFMENDDQHLPSRLSLSSVNTPLLDGDRSQNC